MKKILCALLLAATFAASAQGDSQPKTPPTLRSVLLAQFRTTWDNQNWYVPLMQSLQGLSAKQAMWKPSDSLHSVGQEAYHLLYWNKQALDKFYGRTPEAFDGNNNSTFTAFTEATWNSTVKQLGQIMKDWEKAIEEADDAKLQGWYATIANISTHNAYHTGQILYIRKLAGNWDPEKGVK